IPRDCNNTAFVANQPGKYGSTALNLFSSPGGTNTDVSLVKSFPIGEHLGRLQFRAEFFNTLNQVRFGGPVSNLINNTFGQIQSAGDPRVIQFAVRYQF